MAKKQIGTGSVYHPDTNIMYRDKFEMVYHYGIQYYSSKSDQRELLDEKKAIVPNELTQIPNVLYVASGRCHSTSF